MRWQQVLAMLAAAAMALSARADAGVSDREIVVGQFAAFSGPAAQLGQRLNVGIQAYFKAVTSRAGSMAAPCAW